MKNYFGVIDIYRLRWLEGSGQWLGNVNQTYLERASATKKKEGQSP